MADRDVPERIEVEAMRSLYGSAPGLELRELGGAACLAAPAAPDWPLLNRALGLGLREPASEAGLDAILSAFDGLGVSYYVALAPAARPEQLRDWLADRGLERGYGWVKFRRPARPVPSARTDLRVEPCGPERAEAFAAPLTSAYGLPAELVEAIAALPGRPGWHCFVALDGTRPVAAAALYAAGDAGWLGFAGTLADHRGRGAQGALLAARIARAEALGCREVVTETGELAAGRPADSYRNILRAGFELAYVRPNYVRAQS